MSKEKKEKLSKEEKKEKLRKAELLKEQNRLKEEAAIIESFKVNLPILDQDIDALEKELEKLSAEAAVINDSADSHYVTSYNDAVNSAKTQLMIHGVLFRGIMELFNFKKHYGETDNIFASLSNGKMLYSFRQKAFDSIVNAEITGIQLNDYERCIVDAYKRSVRLTTIEDSFVQTFWKFRIKPRKSDSLVKFNMCPSRTNMVFPALISDDVRREDCSHSLYRICSIPRAVLFAEGKTNETRVRIQKSTIVDMLFNLSDRPDFAVEVFNILSEAAYDIHTVESKSPLLQTEVEQILKVYFEKMTVLNEQYPSDLFEMKLQAQINNCPWGTSDAPIYVYKVTLSVDTKSKTK